MVLAGDISHRTQENRGFLDGIELDCPRCWVPGNHDIWVIDAESKDDTPEYRYRTLFPRLSEESGWCYLPNGPLMLRGFDLALVGNLDWFQGVGYSEWFDHEAGPADEKLARRLAKDLDGQLGQLPKGMLAVVVTHHLAHQASPAMDATRGDIFNSFMEEVINKHRQRVIGHFHGHRHVRYAPREVDGLHFAANPFGYPQQHDRAEEGYLLFEF